MHYCQLDIRLFTTQIIHKVQITKKQTPGVMKKALKTQKKNLIISTFVFSSCLCCSFTAVVASMAGIQVQPGDIVVSLSLHSSNVLVKSSDLALLFPC